MKSLNRVTLLGHVGQEPKVSYPETGRTVARFSVATSRTYKQGNEAKEETEWHAVVAFGGLADIVDQHVQKGRQLYVEGRLQSRKWTDNDGNQRHATEVMAEEVVLLGQRATNEEGIGSEKRGSPQTRRASAAPA
jgi:single-strand DNA-binding protein